MYEKEYDVTLDEGIFTKLCKKFIEYKRGIGQKYPRSNQYNLLHACKHLNNMGLQTPTLTKETVEILAEKRHGESSGTQIKRIRFLRQFAVFMSTLGFEAYVYPKNSMPRYNYDFRPYLFSHEQIQDIIMAADRIIPSNYSPRGHIVYPAILRMMYGCGLRSAEVRKLKVGDVDLDNGILFIEKSKNNTSRYVPMSQSLTDYCRIYVDEMSIISDSQGFFFPAPDGGCLHGFTLQVRFHKIYEDAGIPRLANGRLPRVHDLRHAHIGHTLEKLIKQEGMDVYTAVPLIASYAGHLNMQDTERYLHLPEFHFCDIVNASRTVITDAIPEVIFDEET